jgi:hypothetical protein
MSRRAIFAGGGAIATLALACQWIAQLDEPVAGTPDAAAAPAAVDPCVHAEPPPPPGPVDAPSTEGDGYWMVMRSVVFPIEAGAPIGFDLDRGCTCAADLHDGGPPCANLAGSRSCDLAGGVDDAFATSSDPAGALSDLGTTANQAFARGGGGVLVFLTRYNAGPDDEEVGVALVPTDGLFSNLGCDGQARPGTGGSPETGPYTTTTAPTGDGCDHWRATDGALSNGSALGPIIGAASGYVTGYQLVTTGRALSLPAYGRAADVGVGDLTARIAFVEVAGRPTVRLVDGVAGSRVPLADFTALLAQAGAGAGASGPARCQTQSWPAVLRGLCTSLDSMSAPADDFQGKLCDSFSLRWGFGADPVYIDDAGRPAPALPPPAPCARIDGPAALCDGG